MPEQAPWKFQKIIKDMFELPKSHAVLKGRVLTCNNDEVIENGFVEIENGIITKVGKSSEKPDSRAEVFEVDGTILPGLINSHVHLGWDGIHDLAAQSMNDSEEITAYKAAGNMFISLRAGITMVRDLGLNNTGFATKQAVGQGIVPGPRLLSAGNPIVQTGGHTYWSCREATGADEMRRAVRENVRGGADLIKIMGCHDQLEFTDEELAAVVDEAHRMGVPVTAHATYEECIRRSLDFGVDSIEHGGKMSDDTIKELVRKDVPICTTFSAIVLQAIPELARKYNIPEWKIEERKKQRADASRFDSVVRAAKEGVRIMFGTDAGSPAVQHNMIVPEMEFMVEIGVVENNYAAIRSATAVPAEFHKVSSEIGKIAEGKRADLLAVKGNPLEDLKALENVAFVFRDGSRFV